MKNASDQTKLAQAIPMVLCSDEFKQMAADNALLTLHDLVEALDKLPTLPGSGMGMLKEAMKILRENGLGHLAED